jgi:hypothetical protein
LLVSRFKSIHLLERPPYLSVDYVHAAAERELVIYVGNRATISEAHARIPPYGDSPTSASCHITACSGQSSRKLRAYYCQHPDKIKSHIFHSPKVTPFYRLFGNVQKEII